MKEQQDLLDKYNFIIVGVMIVIGGILASFLTLDVKYMWYSYMLAMSVMSIIIVIKTEVDKIKNEKIN